MDFIKTFLFYDCETTGLPYLENNKTKITELCLEAVHVEHVLSNKSVLPRVRNKLNLAFNPNKQKISQKAAEITGLSNELLQSQSNFSEDTVKLMNSFIDLHPKPACFVAHNGNKFDYPILMAHLKECNEQLNCDILCVDSLDLFREIHYNQERTNKTNQSFFDDGMDEVLSQHADQIESQLDIDKFCTLAQKINETTPKKKKIPQGFVIDIVSTSTVVPKTNLYYNPSEQTAKKSLNFGDGQQKKYTSFKLVDIYERFMERKALDSHTAEGDVKLMIECVAHLGHTFISLANKRAKPLNLIAPLKPF